MLYLPEMKNCGSIKFDNDESMCCNGVLHKRPGCGLPTSHKCCKDQAFSNDYYMCCSGNLDLRQGNKAANKCCKKYAFDQETHMCCNGVIHPRPNVGTTANHKCCKDVAFSNVSQRCLNGLVVDLWLFNKKVLVWRCFIVLPPDTSLFLCQSFRRIQWNFNTADSKGPWKVLVIISGICYINYKIYR